MSVLDLRVNAPSFVACVRKAVDVWLRKRGSADEATVTVDGGCVKIELSPKETFENVQTFGFVNGAVPVSTSTTSDVAKEMPDVFDDELFDLIREQMADSKDLVDGSAGDLG
jgi:hypothetical protein